MHVTVTGATGHIGANLIPLLVSAGHEVRAIYRTAGRHRMLEGLGAELRQGNLLDPAFLESAFSQTDAVIHLAAVISIDGDPGGLVMRTNVEGTRNVVSTCLSAGVKRLIHISSIDAVDYSKTHPVVDEQTPLVGDDAFAYQVSKRRGEEEVWRGVKQGLDAIILCPAAVLGPGDWYVSATGQMLRGIFFNQLPALVNEGFDWVDVRDVAQAVLAALGSDKVNERYLITGHWASAPEVSQICRRISGRPAPNLVLPMWMAYLGLPFLRLLSRLTGKQPLYTREALHVLRKSNRYCSSAKAARHLGYAPRPLETTLRDCWAWYLEQGA